MLERDRRDACALRRPCRLLCVLTGLWLYGCSPSKPATPPAPVAVVAPALFEDATAAAGVALRYFNGAKGMSTMMEQAGPGCALLDYDGDGWLDLYLLNGRDLYGRNIPAKNALYRNKGDGTFEDVTDKAGVPGTGYGIGVAVADYDNDGKPDLYVCQWERNVLYRNRGDGTFEDVTQKAGVGAMEFGEPLHSGAAWLDYDRDGRLDLFVCTYVKFRLDGLRYCKLANGVESNCPPSAYEGTPSLLYHNNGDGTFANVTKQAGVYLPNGKALSALTCDFNADGWTDLFVGNDGTENWLFRNNKNGTFTNVAQEMGVAVARDSASIASMGVDTADYLNNGRLGLFIADWSKRPDHLWLQERDGFFTEVSSPSGIGDAGFPLLGFGAAFLDYDLDGWQDLFLANGHVYPEVDKSSAGETYQQPNQLFRNQGDGTFRETTQEAGAAVQTKRAWRGVAVGDIDNDGDLDILASSNDGLPMLLRRAGAPTKHWVNLQLVGTASNRNAIGAKAWVTTGKRRQMREVKSGGSYLSTSDFRLHFGLGDAAQVTKIEILWTSGRRQTFGGLPADAFYRIQEGATKPEPLAQRR